MNPWKLFIFHTNSMAIATTTYALFAIAANTAINGSPIGFGHSTITLAIMYPVFMLLLATERLLMASKMAKPADDIESSHLKTKAQIKTERRMVYFMVPILFLLMMASPFATYLNDEPLNVLNFAPAFTMAYMFRLLGLSKLRFTFANMYGGSDLVENHKDMARKFIAGMILHKHPNGAEAKWNGRIHRAYETQPYIKVFYSGTEDLKSMLRLHTDQSPLEEVAACYVITGDANPYSVPSYEDLAFDINIDEMTSHQKVEASFVYSDALKKAEELIHRP